MTKEVKWHRFASQIIRAKVGDLEAMVSVYQFGTFASTKRYNWQVSRGDEVIKRGTNWTQKVAKEEAARALFAD